MPDGGHRKWERHSKEGETGRAVFLEEGDLGAEADLERWVGMTQGSSGGGYFRKSNQKQAECEAGNCNHLQCGGEGRSQEKSRRGRQCLGSCMAWWSCMEDK